MELDPAAKAKPLLMPSNSGSPLILVPTSTNQAVLRRCGSELKAPVLLYMSAELLGPILFQILQHPNPTSGQGAAAVAQLN